MHESGMATSSKQVSLTEAAATARAGVALIDSGKIDSKLSRNLKINTGVTKLHGSVPYPDVHVLSYHRLVFYPGPLAYGAAPANDTVRDSRIILHLKVGAATSATGCPDTFLIKTVCRQLQQMPLCPILAIENLVCADCIALKTCESGDCLLWKITQHPVKQAGRYSYQ